METDNLYKPKTLPQISAPFTYVAHHLNSMGQPYEMVGANVDDIKPSQAFIDSDIVSSLMNKLANGEELKAMWLDKDNNALDGHHRYVSYQMHGNSHVPAVRLLCNKETAIKALTEIQKKYESEHSSELLKEITDEKMYVPEKELETSKERITCYRTDNPIEEKAFNGNFFAFIPTASHTVEEDIEFDSLLDTDEIDPKIKKQKNPVFALAEIWFPNINIKEKAKELGTTVEKLITSMVAEKAREKKIDGIKYGDRLLQAIGDK